MKKFLALLILFAACSPVRAEVNVYGPPAPCQGPPLALSGVCTFNTEGEVAQLTNGDIRQRAGVHCRYQKGDETGDGIDEVVDTLVYLTGNGAVDCARSILTVRDGVTDAVVRTLVVCQ